MSGIGRRSVSSGGADRGLVRISIGRSEPWSTSGPRSPVFTEDPTSLAMRSIGAGEDSDDLSRFTSKVVAASPSPSPSAALARPDGTDGLVGMARTLHTYSELVQTELR